MSAPELKIIEVSDGAELTLRLWRTSSAVDIPVLLLHGLSQQGQFWSPVVNRLRAGTVAALDQRGHGRSDVPLNLEFTIPRCALDVAEICAALGSSGFGRINRAGGNLRKASPTANGDDIE